MTPTLKELSLDERLRLVEELWDSIAAEQSAVAMTPEQRAELDRRLAAYETDAAPGRAVGEALSDLRRRL